MIISIILSIIIVLSSSILLAPNPMTAALSLLIIAIIASTTFATLTSTWIAVIVFLVYVAGILVIFAYFVAIIPNQQSIISANPIIISLIMVTSITYIIFRSSNFTILDKSIKITFFYSNNNPATLLALAIVLLLTIVVIVKISNQSKGPLRPFISYV